MTVGTALANLVHGSAEVARPKEWFLPFLLRFEAWLEARASYRTLRGMDDRALADMGLTRADLDREDPATSWRRLLLPEARR